MLTNGDLVELVSGFRQRARPSTCRALFGVVGHYILGWLFLGWSTPVHPRWFSIVAAVGSFGIGFVYAVIGVHAYVVRRRTTQLLQDLGVEADAP